MTTASVIETHVSWVFFVGDRVYKVKKPVMIDVLDLSTLDDRRVACEEEVDLNRRLAPDVYLGVAKILDPDDSIHEYAVVMRRLDPDHQLATALSDPEFDGRGAIDAITDALLAFHRGADRSPTISVAGTVRNVAAICTANTKLLKSVGLSDDQRLVARVDGLQRRFLRCCGAAFVERVAKRRVVDGHGDLQAADIFIEQDGPRILDCLEFSAQLRHGDVLADVAFLAMDLEHLGHRDLAIHLLERYKTRSDDDWPSGLADFWIGCRAQIRAKVASIRRAQGDRGPSAEATSYLTLAAHRLERAVPKLVILGGLPGSGKSTLAHALGRDLGWHIVQSDVVRREILGAGDADTPEFGTGRYGPAQRGAVYRSLVGRAAGFVARGESVILDATWTSKDERQRARTLAETTGAILAEIECRCDDDLAAKRIARRSSGTDPSQATASVRAHLADVADPWPGATTIETSRTMAEALGGAVAAIDAASHAAT